MSRSNNHNHHNQSSWHWPPSWHQDQEITGTDGSDWLFGGWGNDTITGGAGNDRLWGLHGDDLFVFDPGSGHDTIYGFRAGEGSDDVILLRDSGVEDFGTLMTMAVWARGATTFTLPDGSQIVVRGRRPDDFHPDDFRFEVTTLPLFTETGDVVDFNLVLASDYIDGTQYLALTAMTMLRWPTARLQLLLRAMCPVRCLMRGPEMTSCGAARWMTTSKAARAMM